MPVQIEILKPVDADLLTREIIAAGISRVGAGGKLVGVSVFSDGQRTKATVDFSDDLTSTERAALDKAINEHRAFPVPFQYPILSPNGTLWQITINNLGIVTTASKGGG